MREQILARARARSTENRPAIATRRKGKRGRLLGLKDMRVCIRAAARIYFWSGYGACTPSARVNTRPGCNRGEVKSEEADKSARKNDA